MACIHLSPVPSLEPGSKHCPTSQYHSYHDGMLATDYILRGPLLEVCGITQAEVEHNIATWMEMGQAVSRNLGFSDWQGMNNIQRCCLPQLLLWDYGCLMHVVCKCDIHICSCQPQLPRSNADIRPVYFHTAQHSRARATSLSTFYKVNRT